MKKYATYASAAKDTELKELFSSIQKDEQKHYESLGKVLNGEVPVSDCNDSKGKNYQPKANYSQLSSNTDKQYDAFLVTDCIGTEKLVSSEYNSNVFHCSASNIRKLLADIQIEEQNHAEMLFKYKQANNMC